MKIAYLITKAGPEWNEPVEVWIDSAKGKKARKVAAKRCDELDATLSRENSPIDRLSRHVVSFIPVREAK